jgi:tellurite resistance protein TerC
MIAGASWVWWLGFHAVVAALLLADFFLSGTPAVDSSSPGSSDRGARKRRAQARAWLGAAAFALAAAAFAIWIALTQGRRPALEFVAGYTIEASLSVDNLLIFLVLFRGFEISRRRQHKALLWGVWGALVLRAACISAGITLLKRFHWINWIFGLFLLYAAWRLVRSGSAHAVIPEWIRRLQPAKGSLLPVIVAVEFTDLLFATDSIPAVLAVTHNPFIAYTSNIAAILGLRSFYFALAATLDRFRYLHYGLSAILALVAFKMLTARWFEVPILPSLAVIGAILAACAVAPWVVKAGRKRPGTRRRD